MRSPRTRHVSLCAAGALLAALTVTPEPALAQGKGKDKEKERDDDRQKGRTASIYERDDRARGWKRVPPGHLPPAGQCRVWVDGTPPGQQAAPTSCRDAMRDARNIQGARVLVGRGGTVRKGGTVSCENQRNTYPTYAPNMRWGLTTASSGTRPRELRQWHIPAAAVPLVNDFNNDGRPETVVWQLDGKDVQIWHNPDGDGSADIVEIWCNGTEVKEFAY